MEKFTQSEIKEFTEFLDDLREDGDVNMFGASPHLAGMYGLSDSDAREVLGYWMRTYRKR